MDVPRVNPIGLVERPAGYTTRVRRYPGSLRLAASLVLAAFLVVGITTTVTSVGRYCLTSHAGAVGFPIR